MAGESARDLAKRQRDKAARLLKAADLYERGAAGEEDTAAVLHGLPSDQWVLFHHVRWPGRERANIDHVAVGPPGIFVIDSKNWTGRIEVRDQVLRQRGRAREEAVAGASDAALAVAGLLPSVTPAHVHPVLCFTRDEPIADRAREVTVCSTATITDLLL